MPTYEFLCQKCSNQFELRLPMSESHSPQECGLCGHPAGRIISMPSFILKGDDWVGKNLRIKSQMAERNRKASIRQDQLKREAPGVRLAPNVDGERVDSWSEAKKLAASKGKDTTSYEAKIREEKKA